MLDNTTEALAADALPLTRTAVDWGRVVMVSVSVIFGTLAVGEVMVLASGDARSTAVSAAIVAGVLTALFYCLIVWAYLRRGPARATSRVTLALIAAPVATFLPFALPHVATGGTSTGRVTVGSGLLLVGLLFSVWSVRCLDRSLSVVPQARVLVQHGPYRLVRHPLYLGELVAMLGLALTLGGALPIVGWALLVLLQCYRAVQEESLLTSFLPGYEAYRSRTARVVPGLF